MAEIVNLRRERKRRERAEASQATSENRVRHGRTKTERANDDDARTRAAKSLDGRELVEPPPQ